MPRPKINRRINFDPKVKYYKPQGIPMRILEEVELLPDEVEAIRLADYEGNNQTEAAKQMKISQSTFQRIVTKARHKIAQAMVEGKAIRIDDTK